MYQQAFRASEDGIHEGLPGVTSLSRTRDQLEYMRTVSRGSPVDPPRSVAGMVLSTLRHGRRHAPDDSPLAIQDVLASSEYRDLMTPKVAEGESAPDFELPRMDDAGTIRASTLWSERPLALIFGSYT